LFLLPYFSQKWKQCLEHRLIFAIVQTGDGKLQGEILFSPDGKVFRIFLALRTLQTRPAIKCPIVGFCCRPNSPGWVERRAFSGLWLLYSAPLPSAWFYRGIHDTLHSIVSVPQALANPNVNNPPANQGLAEVAPTGLPRQPWFVPVTCLAPRPGFSDLAFLQSGLILYHFVNTLRLLTIVLRVFDESRIFVIISLN